MLIDHQAHWHPPEYFERLLGRSEVPYARRWQGDGYQVFFSGGRIEYFGPKHINIDDHVRDMDNCGIAVAKLSPSIIGELADLPEDEAVALAMWLNREFSEVQSKFDGRFDCLAVLPMAYPHRAIEVLNNAVLELALTGVCLFSNAGGRLRIGKAEFALFRRIAELRIPIYLHPAAVSQLAPILPARTSERGLGWMVDTSIAALELIESGIFDEFPDLLVVHPHAGGVVPYVSGRLSGILSRSRDRQISGNVGRDVMSTLQHNFYVDCVTETDGALDMASGVYGVDHILFATDYPWLPRERMLQRLENLPQALGDAVRANSVRQLRDQRR